MKVYNGPKFTKEQLIFMVELVIVGALDRIEATLPDNAANKNQLDDYMANRNERLNMILGCKQVVAASLAILYAQLTNDGMGIGDFPQYQSFENQVSRFIRRKTDPSVNRNNNTVGRPLSYDLARQFVKQFFGGAK